MALIDRNILLTTFLEDLTDMIQKQKKFISKFITSISGYQQSSTLFELVDEIHKFILSIPVKEIFNNDYKYIFRIFTEFKDRIEHFIELTGKIENTQFNQIFTEDDTIEKYSKTYNTSITECLETLLEFFKQYELFYIKYNGLSLSPDESILNLENSTLKFIDLLTIYEAILNISPNIYDTNIAVKDHLTRFTQYFNFYIKTSLENIYSTHLNSIFYNYITYETTAHYLYKKYINSLNSIKSVDTMEINNYNELFVGIKKILEKLRDMEYYKKLYNDKISNLDLTIKIFDRLIVLYKTVSDLYFVRSTFAKISNASSITKDILKLYVDVFEKYDIPSVNECKTTLTTCIKWTDNLYILVELLYVLLYKYYNNTDPDIANIFFKQIESFKTYMESVIKYILCIISAVKNISIDTDANNIKIEEKDYKNFIDIIEHYINYIDKIITNIQTDSIQQTLNTFNISISKNCFSIKIIDIDIFAKNNEMESFLTIIDTKQSDKNILDSINIIYTDNKEDTILRNILGNILPNIKKTNYAKNIKLDKNIHKQKLDESYTSKTDDNKFLSSMTKNIEKINGQISITKYKIENIREKIKQLKTFTVTNKNMSNIPTKFNSLQLEFDYLTLESIIKKYTIEQDQKDLLFNKRTEKIKLLSEKELEYIKISKQINIKKLYETFDIKIQDEMPINLEEEKISVLKSIEDIKEEINKDKGLYDMQIKIINLEVDNAIKLYDEKLHVAMENIEEIEKEIENIIELEKNFNRSKIIVTTIQQTFEKCKILISTIKELCDDGPFKDIISEQTQCQVTNIDKELQTDYANAIEKQNLLQDTEFISVSNDGLTLLEQTLTKFRSIELKLTTDKTTVLANISAIQLKDSELKKIKINIDQKALTEQHTQLMNNLSAKIKEHFDIIDKNFSTLKTNKETILELCKDTTKIHNVSEWKNKLESIITIMETIKDVTNKFDSEETYIISIYDKAENQTSDDHIKHNIKSRLNDTVSKIQHIKSTTLDIQKITTAKVNKIVSDSKQFIKNIKIKCEKDCNIIKNKVIPFNITNIAEINQLLTDISTLDEKIKHTITEISDMISIINKLEGQEEDILKEFENCRKNLEEYEKIAYVNMIPHIKLLIEEIIKLQNDEQIKSLNQTLDRLIKINDFSRLYNSHIQEYKVYNTKIQQCSELIATIKNKIEILNKLFADIKSIESEKDEYSDKISEIDAVQKSIYTIITSIHDMQKSIELKLENQIKNDIKVVNDELESAIEHLNNLSTIDKSLDEYTDLSSLESILNSLIDYKTNKYSSKKNDMNKKLEELAHQLMIIKDMIPNSSISTIEVDDTKYKELCDIIKSIYENINPVLKNTMTKLISKAISTIEDFIKDLTLENDKFAPSNIKSILSKSNYDEFIRIAKETGTSIIEKYKLIISSLDNSIEQYKKNIPNGKIEEHQIFTQKKIKIKLLIEQFNKNIELYEKLINNSDITCLEKEQNYTKLLYANGYETSGNFFKHYLSDSKNISDMVYISLYKDDSNNSIKNDISLINRIEHIYHTNHIKSIFFSINIYHEELKENINSLESYYVTPLQELNTTFNVDITIADYKINNIKSIVKNINDIHNLLLRLFIMLYIIIKKNISYTPPTNKRFTEWFLKNIYLIIRISKLKEILQKIYDMMTSLNEKYIKFNIYLNYDKTSPILQLIIYNICNINKIYIIINKYITILDEYLKILYILYIHFIPDIMIIYNNNDEDCKKLLRNISEKDNIETDNHYVKQVNKFLMYNFNDYDELTNEGFKEDLQLEYIIEDEEEEINYNEILYLYNSLQAYTLEIILLYYNIIKYCNDTLSNILNNSTDDYPTKCKIVVDFLCKNIFIHIILQRITTSYNSIIKDPKNKYDTLIKKINISEINLTEFFSLEFNFSQLFSDTLYKYNKLVEESFKLIPQQKINETLRENFRTVLIPNITSPELTQIITTFINYGTT